MTKLVRQLALFSSLAAALVSATPRAGNEDYAVAARALLKRASANPVKRSSPSFEADSVSFSVGEGDDAKFYLSPTGEQHKSYTLSQDWGLDAYAGKTLPVTVINVAGEVTCDVLSAKVAAYSSADDVWDQLFMQTVLLQSSSAFNVESDVASCLAGGGGDLVIKSGPATSNLTGVSVAHVAGDLVPQGPYLAKIGSGEVRLTEVYRLYRDENQAMTTAVIPLTDGSFEDLASPVPGMNTLSIPVPSRLYTANLTNPRPLEGKRIAVKDIYDVKGLRSGCGNRAYFNTYPARNATAVAIQRLLDQGAILVAKAKTSSFANGETATADWVDQMCPYNPRGDGYQNPSSSSSGPGAAIASYDWLDNTIGSDTGCSILCPSGANGVFGMRPTWNAISLEGVMPLQPLQDTAGFFTRDAVEGAKFSRGWYGDRFGNYSSWPKTLILPTGDWTFPATATYASAFNAFKQSLIEILQPETIDNRSWGAFWNDSGEYVAQGNQTNSQFLNTVYGDVIDYWQWHNFGQPWFEDYAAQHGGRNPFIAPSPATRWGWGRVNVSDAQYNESIRRRALYGDWVRSTVLVPTNDTCSKTIYAVPYNLGTTSYRNLYGNPPSNGYFGGDGNESFFTGSPQIVIPIGQRAYNSSVSNTTEYLPLSATLYAAPNCDYVLWDIAAALQTAGAISPVLTGKTPYPVSA